MPDSSLVAAQEGLGATRRQDAWWVAPLLTVLGLTVFAVYVPWAALQPIAYSEFTKTGTYYLSPFFSPNLRELLGIEWRFWPFLILWIPGGFRATCYYYRKAYYRSFFADPPACAVGEPKRNYCGEAKFPFLLQNIHRYFFYGAGIVLAFLWYDAARAFFFWEQIKGEGVPRYHFGMGVGSLVLLINCICLTGFTFGCNSLRHLIGGRLDCFTCSAMARTRFKLWNGVTFFNLKHMEWAWVSLFTVGFADLYIRLCAMGIWTDFRIF